MMMSLINSIIVFLSSELEVAIDSPVHLLCPLCYERRSDRPGYLGLLGHLDILP